jgi:hypothetical protein
MNKSIENRYFWHYINDSFNKYKENKDEYKIFYINYQEHTNNYKLIEEFVYKNDIQIYDIKYLKNSDNKIIEKEIYNEKKLLEKKSYYGFNNNIIRELEYKYYFDNQLFIKNKITRDYDNNITIFELYDKNCQITKKIVINNDTNETKKLEYNNGLPIELAKDIFSKYLF